MRRRRAEPAPAVPEAPALTAEETAWYHQQFRDGKGCPTCGGIHARSCPRVRSVEYETAGGKVSIKRVTFWPPGQWSDEGIVFADELPDTGTP